MNDQTMRRNVDEWLDTVGRALLDRNRIIPKSALVSVAVRAQAGDTDAYDQLVNGMSRMVFAEAYSTYRTWRRMLPPQASFDDVYGAGLEGLHRATTKFDAERGNAFTTHAKAWIRNACQRAVYSQIGVARIPERTLRAGLPPLEPLVANSTLSLDAIDMRHGRERQSIHESLPAPVFDEAFDVEMVRGILDVLTCVDSRLPTIIELLQCDYAYRQVGKIVGISADRVRQLVAAGADAVEHSGLADDYLA